jgi:Holliday junction resolvase RusA-like endonuclease
MPEGQLSLPVIPGPALVVGPVFLCFEYEAGVPKGRIRSTPVVPFKHKHGARIAFSRSGKPFVHEYPHPESRVWETAIGQLAKIWMRGKPPSTRPLALLVHSFIPVPPSWSARDIDLALAGGILPTSKPDWDNYGKITDALNGVAWIDDAQVVHGCVIKRYSARPALRIEVREFIDPT